MTKIHLIGLNHRTATVEIREKFALNEFTSPSTWPFSCTKHHENIENTEHNVSQNNLSKLAVDEALIISTCNRVEILAVYDGPPEDLIQAWCDVRCASFEELRPYVYTYEGKEAIKHLFKVASSLDSLVLGEPQILGQLKAAYRLSVAANHAGLMLNRLLHKSFSVAKRVRSETGVASSAVSISYAAVELAKRIFEDMSKQRALLLGAGEMAELAAVHLISNGIARLCIVNRTLSRAEELANRIGGEALAFESLTDCLLDVDIVISSTGSQEPIIDADMIREVMKQRKNRPMFFIDIAMPRDVDPAVNTLDSVYVYDIDDLKEVVEENLAQRKGEALKGAAIVDEESSAFEIWRGSLTLKPTILDIEEKGNVIAKSELERTLKRLEKLGIYGEELEKALEKMAQSIVRKCHHAPLHHLAVSYKHNQSEQSIGAVRQILKLDDD